MLPLELKKQTALTFTWLVLVICSVTNNLRTKLSKTGIQILGSDILPAYIYWGNNVQPLTLNNLQGFCLHLKNHSEENFHMTQLRYNQAGISDHRTGENLNKHHLPVHTNPSVKKQLWEISIKLQQLLSFPLRPHQETLLEIIGSTGLTGYTLSFSTPQRHWYKAPDIRHTVVHKHSTF